MTLTVYDWLLARRTFALGFVLAVLVFLVMLGTDDSTSTLASRLGRLAALVSLAGGAGAFIATEQARSRGEIRALSAMGVAPAKTSIGAIIGGFAVAAIGPALALVHRVDLSSLFPRIPSAGGWVPQGDAWLDVRRGILVRASGELSQVGVGATAADALGRGVEPRLATALALGLASLAFPFWATARGSSVRRSLVALAVAGASIALFHWVGAGQMGSLALSIPPALLLADAISLHRRSSWL